MNQQNLADFIWNVADTLRGNFKQSEFGRIILPFTVLRRLECVLEPTRKLVQQQYTSLKGSQVDLDLVLPSAAKASFYNVSEFSLSTVGSTSTRANLEDYIAKFSANARQVFERFAFDGWLAKLETANLLYLVTEKFATIDLHPDAISNHEMGLVFEHLIRKFAESANDTAGEFFTPRDVVRLVTTLVFSSDHEALNGEGVVRTVYDCAAGNSQVMAQVRNATRGDAMKADLPMAINAAIAGAMLTHQSLATKLLSHEGEGARDLFLAVVYEMLKKDLGGDLLKAARGG